MITRGRRRCPHYSASFAMSTGTQLASCRQNRPVFNQNGLFRVLRRVKIPGMPQGSLKRASAILSSAIFLVVVPGTLVVYAALGGFSLGVRATGLFADRRRRYFWRGNAPGTRKRKNYNVSVKVAVYVCPRKGIHDLELETEAGRGKQMVSAIIM